MLGGAPSLMKKRSSPVMSPPRVTSWAIEVVSWQHAALSPATPSCASAADGTSSARMRVVFMWVFSVSRLDAVPNQKLDFLLRGAGLVALLAERHHPPILGRADRLGVRV